MFCPLYTCRQPVWLTPGFCGGYRSRTDDPLRARQVLWPAELIPLSAAVSLAKAGLSVGCLCLSYCDRSALAKT
jgi:hypothetical protein